MRRCLILWEKRKKTKQKKYAYPGQILFLDASNPKIIRISAATFTGKAP